MLSRLTGGRKRGGGGLPINPKMLTGLLGAGAAGTALIRKRRAGRADSPDVTPVSAADRNETDRVAG